MTERILESLVRLSGHTLLGLAWGLGMLCCNFADCLEQPRDSLHGSMCAELPRRSWNVLDRRSSTSTPGTRTSGRVRGPRRGSWRTISFGILIHATENAGGRPAISPYTCDVGRWCRCCCSVSIRRIEGSKSRRDPRAHSGRWSGSPGTAPAVPSAQVVSLQLRLQSDRVGPLPCPSRRGRRIITTRRDDSTPRSSALVKRNFTVSAPNQLWVI